MSPKYKGYPYKKSEKMGKPMHTKTMEGKMPMMKMPKMPKMKK